MKKHGQKLTLGILMLAGILGSGGSLAYLVATTDAVNKTAVGRNITDIREDFPDQPGVENEENPHYKKTVWVANTGGGESGYNVDCYVRAALSYSNYDIGKAVTLENLNTADWEYHTDGYYYYRYALKEGEVTTPLFTGFQIDRSQVEESFSDYISDFSIYVYEESVQAYPFSDCTEAFAYYLNPVSEA
ncbi:MAG: hypothetical protein KBT01_01690 [Clostridiales bacterium]|nr:hypothetical protein [Candidatus Blautia equi]